MVTPLKCLAKSYEASLWNLVRRLKLLKASQGRAKNRAVAREGRSSKKGRKKCRVRIVAALIIYRA